jgi:hypothetical protein
MWLPQQIQNLFLFELVRNLLTIFFTVYRTESRQLTSNLQIITSSAAFAIATWADATSAVSILLLLPSTRSTTIMVIKFYVILLILLMINKCMYCPHQSASPSESNLINYSGNLRPPYHNRNLRRLLGESSSSVTLLPLITFRNTLSSVAFSTLYSWKSPCDERMWNNCARVSPPSCMGTSKRVATSSARREPGIRLMRTWALIASSRVGHEKCTWYVA